MAGNKPQKHMSNTIFDVFCAENFQYSNQGRQDDFTFGRNRTSFICQLALGEY